MRHRLLYLGGVAALPLVWTGTAASAGAPTLFGQAAAIQHATPNTDKYGVPTGTVTNKGGEAVAVLDANGDGVDDFVVVNGTEYYHVVLTHPGPGGVPTFQSAPAAPIGPETDRVANQAKGLGTHDLDRDGRLDLYFGNQGRGALNAINPRDLDTILDPANIEDHNRYRDHGYRTQLAAGDGTFTPVALGANGDGGTRTAVFADFDGDGHDDVYLSNAAYYGIWWGSSSAPNQLLPGRADGTFGPDLLRRAVPGGGDVFADSLGRAAADFKGAIVRDFDGDGRPDLVNAAYADVWDSVGTPPLAPAQPAGGQVDLDGDGLPDGGYQGTWSRGLLVLRNVSEPGHIRFANVSETATDNGLAGADRMHVYVTAPADIDHDGDLDLLASGPRNFTAQGSLEQHTDMVRVYRNDSTPGTIRFTNVTAQSGVAFLNNDDTLRAATGGLYPIRIPKLMADGTDFLMYPLLSSAAAVDIDNDGDMDWIAVDRQFTSRNPLTGKEFDLWVFRNDGTGHFDLVPPAEHGLRHTARDLSYADLNGDGRLDIITVNGSGGGQTVDDNSYVFLNKIVNDNHHLDVAVGLPGNPFGIGTKVTVLGAGDPGVIGYEELRTDFGYRSKRAPKLHFGLGPATTVDLRLATPDGQRLTVTGVAGDRAVRLVGVDVQRTPGLGGAPAYPDRRRGVVTLALLGSTALDVSTLGDLTAHPAGSTIEDRQIRDVNRDGVPDLVVRIRPAGSGPVCVSGWAQPNVVAFGCLPETDEHDRR
ncbi:MAG: VCBS repeat-containing protein [Actinobacteria bacterium]|nr:VCBS repeat-containing protein [Actinomycetota bacterium]